MKSLLGLWSTLADDLAKECCTSATRDINTVSVRTEHEGLSFLTITLPQFGKDFELSLDRGAVDRQDFQGFSWKSGLPVFLWGFLSRVFDAKDGRLVDEPDVAAIRAIRQFMLLYSKLFLLINYEREKAAMQKFIDCEKEVTISDARLTDQMRSDFSRIANIVLGRTLMKIDREIADPLNVYPAHGPGATADKLIGNAKYNQNTWPLRLEKVFHSVDHLLPSPSYFEELEGVHFLEPEMEIPVKVISVPKTQKTPRIIAVEPTAMQYAQQSVRSIIYEEVARDNLLDTFIGFTDQTPNQELACEGSLNGELATLDLSEASDRVSCLHVEDLLAFTPHLREAVFACRSTKADVQGHGIVSLAKFASMGSALSFPIEAMVFLTIVFYGVEQELNRPLTRKDVKSFLGRVRVFGDDIIVPKDYVHSTIRSLEAFGLKVNRHKSFWTGKFRESCGKEYYHGHDVSIVKVRQLAPSSLSDVLELTSWVDLSNQLYYVGYWQSVRLLDQLLSGILKDFPVVLPTSPVLGRHSFMGYQSQKTGGRYQIPLVKGFVRRDPIPVNSLDGSRALLKVFLERKNDPLFQEDHLRRSGRPLSVNMKRGWYSAL
jgi:hypothetical protein